jgi:hypothetical protein
MILMETRMPAPTKFVTTMNIEEATDLAKPGRNIMPAIIITEKQGATVAVSFKIA